MTMNENGTESSHSSGQGTTDIIQGQNYIKVERRTGSMTAALRLAVLLLVTLTQCAAANTKPVAHRQSEKDDKSHKNINPFIDTVKSTSIAKKTGATLVSQASKISNMIEKKTKELDEVRFRHSKRLKQVSNQVVQVSEQVRQNEMLKSSGAKINSSVKPKPPVKVKKDPPKKKKSTPKTKTPKPVKEFPLSEIIFKGRSSNEANAFIKANDRLGKSMEIVYEQAREQDLNDIEQRLQQKYLEYTR